MGEPLQVALPRELYVDPSAWQVERETVLFGEWFCVGRVEALGLSEPNRLAVVDVVGESILLTSDATRDLHAAYNVCRHRGSQVQPALAYDTEPKLSGAAALRCPYHSWTYGLDGCLLKAPHAEVPNPDDFRLKQVAVGTWGGFVFVHLNHLSTDSPSLDESVLGPATSLANYGLADLVTGATLTYEVAANYKVVLENYNECYHCGPVHPELCRLVPAFAGGGGGLDWDAGIEHREGAWTFTTTGTTDRAPLPDLDESERTRHKGDLVYPNLMISASADHVAAFVLQPLAVDRTHITCSLLFNAEEVARSTFDPADAVDLWHLVNEQDWAICESVQRGMTSRSYTHGWFAPMEDDSLDIRRWLLPRLDRVDPSAALTAQRSTSDGSTDG